MEVVLIALAKAAACALTGAAFPWAWKRERAQCGWLTGIHEDYGREARKAAEDHLAACHGALDAAGGGGRALRQIASAGTANAYTSSPIAGPRLAC